ncbi:MAG: DUF3108 domain-containing protein [Candidatus Margulisbacteria bacterium]|nr:DUF3108 domain-containing protein [Candidatus Margulisiibacteriota bacterium]MBU1021464.1 DUF3108 domain-containing protein [Candidatus Margulisiibacteriota bacterium]MBU1728385.1 DUF3108 domain-containing protein [Candidatus Margulisiibacteriota bacterium]MBU1955872.1 DUF3108 domain-containing protein [Candidatus Margulisiibacteriota bacterium]
MKKFVIGFSVLLCFALFVIGCATVSGGGGGSNYFPASDGNSWRHLDNNEGTQYVTVEGNKVITTRGDSVSAMDVTTKIFKSTTVSTSGGYSYSESYYVVNDSGVYYYGSSSGTTTEGQPFFEFPLVLGNSWTVTQGGGYTFIASVEGQEDVTVPAGTYSDCFKVVFRPYVGSVLQPGYINFWLADGVGQVKYEISIGGAAGLVQLTWTNLP